MRLTSKLWVLLSAALLASPAVAEPTQPPQSAGSPGALLPSANPGGQQHQLGSGVIVTTASGTTVSRSGKLNLQLGASGGKMTPTYVFQLSQGLLHVQIPMGELNRIAVLVTGPKGVSAVVRAGQGVILADQEGVHFTTTGHSMLVGKGSRWRTLKPGRTRLVDPQTGRGKDLPPLTPPVIKSRSELAAVLPGKGFRAAVELIPMPNAASYQVALLKQEGGQYLLTDHTTSTSASVALKGDAAGRYVVVARAMDKAGNPGALSKPLPVRVFGVELPTGARTLDHTVLLPPRKRLPLIGAEGLKMTYGNGSYFIDAPTSIGMARGTQTTVRFRKPSGGPEVRLTLAPQIVKAAVQLSPRTAKWPSDEVTAMVRLVDGNGNVIKDERKTHTSVSINLQAVDVQWKRKGDLVTGSINPPHGVEGPWVVRVEVKNEEGEVIGRDFLEVIGNDLPPPAQRKDVAQQ